MSRITVFQGFYNPQIKWKSNTPLNKSGFVVSNAPSNIKPLLDSEDRSAPKRKPKPLPIYRRGRSLRQVASSKTTLRESLENPGTYITNNTKTQEELCNDCNGLPLLNVYGNKLIMSNNPETNDQCFSQEKFSKARNRNPKFNVKKTYFTRLEDYRKHKGKVNKTNIYYTNPENCSGLCKDIDMPTNHKYHVNGAVTSSTRLERLKLEAVNKSKQRYVGDYKEPYNQKSKTDYSNCKVYGVSCIKPTVSYASSTPATPAIQNLFKWNMEGENLLEPVSDTYIKYLPNTFTYEIIKDNGNWCPISDDYDQTTNIGSEVGIPLINDTRTNVNLQITGTFTVTQTNKGGSNPDIPNQSVEDPYDKYQVYVIIDGETFNPTNNQRLGTIHHYDNNTPNISKTVTNVSFNTVSLMFESEFGNLDTPDENGNKLRIEIRDLVITITPNE